MLQPEINESGICYFAPRHGASKIIYDLPESYKLHICPSACGRRYAIHALSLGNKANTSFLHITETDVVSGHYEDIIGDAIGEILIELTIVPKVFILNVKCIDDLLGTDEPALLDRLYQRFPRLHFMVFHVDPIKRDKKHHGISTNIHYYDLLEYSGKKDQGINVIGNVGPIEAESDLSQLLSGCGVDKVRQYFTCKTFAEFQQMADSRLNLVVSPMAAPVAHGMLKKLDIPFLVSRYSYDLEEIASSYRDIAAALGRPCPDLGPEIVQTQQAVKNTLAYIGKLPIIIDSSPGMHPLALAKVLCRYGFNVQAIFCAEMREALPNDRRWLEEQYPQIPLIWLQKPELTVNFSFGQECIAIGFNCGYLIKAHHFVDVFDQSFFGFQGVRKLMRQICQAFDTPTDWEQVIASDKESRSL
jgi:hypothetical protein